MKNWVWLVLAVQNRAQAPNCKSTVNPFKITYTDDSSKDNFWINENSQLYQHSAQCPESYIFNSANPETGLGAKGEPCTRGKMLIDFKDGYSVDDYEWDFSITLDPKRPEDESSRLNQLFAKAGINAGGTDRYMYIKQILENPRDDIPFIPNIEAMSRTEFRTRFPK